MKVVNWKMVQNTNAQNSNPSAGNFSSSPVSEGSIKEVRVTEKEARIVLQSGQIVKLGEKERQYLYNMFANGGQLFVWKEADEMNGRHVYNNYLNYYWLIVRRLQQKGLIKIYKIKMGRGAPSTKAELTALGYSIIKRIIKGDN